MRAWRAALLAVAAIAACGRVRSAGDEERGGPTVASNVERADYAGSAACKDCHRDIYARWLASPMHNMTRDAKTAVIRAPFDGRVFRFMGDSARMESHEGRRYMLVDSRDQGHRIYKITKVIGGRYREDFVGVEVAGTGRYSGVVSAEHVLPVSWLIFDGRFRYKGYSVMTPERGGLRRGERWRTTCIFCHDTEPYLDSTLDELHGPGSPGFQGSASIALPDTRRFRFQITDADALGDAVASELSAIGAPPVRANDVKALLAGAMRETRRHFDAGNLIEIGIGCEDCHGGSREHARAPTHVLPTFAVKSRFMHVLAPDGSEPTAAENINRSCERCHTVLFSHYRATWEGGSLGPSPGGSSITSGEARDFLLGGCSKQMSCAACHDPHTKDSRAHLDALAGPAGTRLCTSCHDRYRDPAAIAAHTHHAPDSAGSQCIECHMPRKNMGLAYTLTRYHRIGSPTDRARVEGDRPLECALCHADKSVAELVTTMERWWHKRYDRGALQRLYGPDLSVNPAVATLERGKPHEQAVAISIAGRAKMRVALPLLVRQLDNPYPLVRFYAQRAIEQVTGKPLDLDMHARGQDLVRAANAQLRTTP